MGSFASEKKRRIIPRWRDFKTTASTGELFHSGKNSASLPLFDKSFLTKKIGEWEYSNTTETAAELVMASLVAGQKEIAGDAANFLLTEDSSSTISLQMIARKIVGVKGEPGLSPTTDMGFATLSDETRIMARLLKQSLIESPRNSIAWVDLSRAYAIQGQFGRAVGAMENALKIDGNNRFVLRSASRLFAHVGEIDRAHKILEDSENARTDPWIIAAEIASASVAEKRSNNVKRARQILQSTKFLPFHTAELASAVASIDMDAGSFRQSRRMFRNSLAHPTDNAVAQAEWASTRIGDFSLEQKDFSLPLTFEAKALRAYHLTDWNWAITHTKDWLLDEPFSTRPASFGSNLASVALGDYKLANFFTTYGLDANPNDVTLNNNKAFDLGNLGKVKEARQILSTISRPASMSWMEVMLTATDGFLSFREGNAALGRHLYETSIKIAQESSMPNMATIAKIYLYREEAGQGNLDEEGLLTLAGQIRQWGDHQEYLLLIDRIYKEFYKLVR